ncbi:hypothetical protein VF14_11635 [Nostoc linckia z18]|uniref:Uncharacterized protein n=2 Tax=Nostoc linckia TaxID=92942 RepID=A0A9Q5ZA18_NOSLI|nr:hypothetical protein [Nostoc linckia]PHK40894.1 hypothetical protein VF12_08615 [Nostoc linckia z15]PHK46437.1 hypothetical protein VF13_10850 [Nostoc linckia z16]PHJ60237.1 hypothetical protein VF02_23005 [Nostoc linckia z1]PHJ63803.1 hypothetical protein VF05_23970 [Nostoc linckia z3]PHJ70817.1 hypothetical protein VF03_21540 [Nostoc linckia z2]
MPLYNPPATFNFPVDSSSTATEVTNSLSTTASEIIPANTNRKGLTIFNTLNQTVYIDAVTGLTTTNYMVAIPAGGFYELPTNKIYTGHFYGILASGTGSVEIREFT